ncbi:hypothetical protein CXG81DRAFT_27718 [Caulochytrium protostelioides]|uniref:Uncharacterized protein n=1 Tax=Caulochytrium protostelioides TaxID=1555241 RepID=A0A4P9X3E0_9FUNG|nr:hypothetical protein CXG81DRAFT_27718 [Caulochytrium protostelioides]|eukprot:RKO99536.1 hypothetical protein CXG81DRAFT_27718 [Caulochytrium protostelioides]
MSWANFRELSVRAAQVNKRQFWATPSKVPVPLRARFDPLIVGGLTLSVSFYFFRDVFSMMYISK